MTLDRRRFLQDSGALAAAPALGRTAAAQSAARKVFRYAFPSAETGFDPAQISDLYSVTITSHIYDSLYAYDYLARPARIRSLAAAAMPGISDDFRVFTFRVRPGILFQDDPAFNGRKRELVAQDFVYSLKRFFDPRWKSPVFPGLEEYKILGLNELRQRSLKEKIPFDYDTKVEGLHALDRYTLQIRLRDTAPHFAETFASPGLYGAVAREVVEAYGDTIMAHPVGTGPFRLIDWRRSSRIVLERNPNYRADSFDGSAAADDPRSRQVAAALDGRKLPLVDRVEVYIIEEQQPRWLAFLNAEHDLLDRLPNDFVNIAAPGGRMAPSLKKRGIQMSRVLGADITYTVFNMKHPVIGGYTPEKVALRRAISLALNVDEEIRIPRRGQAVAAQAPINPHTYGYDPNVRTEMGIHDLPRAKALLDIFGYIDRDGDGWREQPDGSALVIEYSTPPDQGQRQLDEIRKRNFDKLGVKLELKYGKWPELLKSARAAKFMSWALGSSANGFDSRPALQRGYGPAAGGPNLSHFDHPEYNRIYDRVRVTPNGPERLELIRQAVRILTAYVPYKVHVHRIFTDMWHPWVANYVRHPFQSRFWEHIDVDAEQQAKDA
jgi:ABC-type transport system substrate-binding protein